MRCRLCKLRFSKQQTRKAVSLYDEQGRLEGMCHFKCVYIAKKRGWIGQDPVNGRYFETSPTSWDQIRRTSDDLTTEEQERLVLAESEYAALQARLKEIELQAALEERPSRWDDWRSPETLDLDELLSVSKHAKEVVGEDAL